jgi:hypothetical protein
MEITVTKKRFQQICVKCNFTANRPKEWLIHIETNKHKQDGHPKCKKCDICNTIFANHWIQKMHKLKIHSSSEERAKSPYYCSICDLVFISPLYLEKHINGKIHINLAKALDNINLLNKNII